MSEANRVSDLCRGRCSTCHERPRYRGRLECNPCYMGRYRRTRREREERRCDCGQRKDPRHASCEGCRAIAATYRQRLLDEVAMATRDGRSAREIAASLDRSERHIVRVRGELKRRGRLEAA